MTANVCRICGGNLLGSGIGSSRGHRFSEPSVYVTRHGRVSSTHILAKGGGRYMTVHVDRAPAVVLSGHLCATRKTKSLNDITLAVTRSLVRRGVRVPFSSGSVSDRSGVAVLHARGMPQDVLYVVTERIKSFYEIRTGRTIEVCDVPKPIG